MATKTTKAQLEEELALKREEINDLKEQLKQLEKYEQYRTAAGEIKAIHDSFIDAGFTDDQALQLVITSMATATSTASTINIVKHR